MTATSPMPKMPAPPRFVRNPDLIAADMDGELVMMSLERGTYFGLGGVGSRVWNLLETPQTQDVLIATICAEFDTDAPTCAADLQPFLDDLLRNDLIRTV